MSKKTSDYLLCRAKSTETNEWIFGSPLCIGRKRYVITIPPNKKSQKILDNLAAYATEVKPKTIGRYVGTDDTNSNPIFEGDILCEKVEYNRVVVKGDVLECYHVIKWAENYNSFVAFPIENGRMFGKQHLLLDNFQLIKQNSYYVVGNIYDNDLSDYICRCKE